MMKAMDENPYEPPSELQAFEHKPPLPLPSQPLAPTSWLIIGLLIIGTLLSPLIFLALAMALPSL
jgi:hypothetical protein